MWWGVAPDRVLYGSWVVSRTSGCFRTSRAGAKFLNFGVLVARFPESGFVFVGDTGELDGQARGIHVLQPSGLMACVCAHCRNE